MNIEIISSLIKIANKLDKIGFYQEANILTKIANNETDDLIVEDYDERKKFLSQYSGSIIKFTRFKSPDTGAILYQTIYRLRGKVNETEPTNDFKKARKEFEELTDKFPRTPYLHLPEYERYRPKKPKSKGDWEPAKDPYEWGPGYK